MSTFSNRHLALAVRQTVTAVLAAMMLLQYGFAAMTESAATLHLAGVLFVATDSRGHVYVTDLAAQPASVVEVNSSGHLVRRWASNAVGVAVSQTGHVLTSGPFGMTEFDQAGKILARWGKPSLPPEQLVRLQGIAVDAAGNSYVADAFRHRILKYSSGHKLVKQWRMRNPTKEDNAGPNGIAVDKSGNVYITDAGNHRTVQYDPTGRELHVWKLPGRRPRLLGGPGLGGIALDRAGNIYVADRYTDTLVEMSSRGTVVARTRGSALAGLYGVTVDKNGIVFATADTPTARIVKLSPHGKVLAVWR